MIEVLCDDLTQNLDFFFSAVNKIFFLSSVTGKNPGQLHRTSINNSFRVFFVGKILEVHIFRRTI